MYCTLYKIHQKQVTRTDLLEVNDSPSGELIYLSSDMILLDTHLCFKQAQLKMCHSPKVDDGVDIFFKTSLTPLFGPFLLKNLKLTSYLNR